MIDTNKWVSEPCIDWQREIDRFCHDEIDPSENIYYGKYSCNPPTLKCALPVSIIHQQYKKSRHIGVTNIYLKNKKLCRIAGVTLEDGCKIWINDKFLKNLVIEECEDPTLEGLIKEIKK